MTPEQLAAIRARADAATPGPWRVFGNQVVAENPNDPDGVGVSLGYMGYQGPKPRDWNARFTAAARSDIPALLDEVARLQAANAALTAGLQWALDEGGWRLWYYSGTVPPIIATTTSGYPATIRDPDPVAARYLAVVEAARAWRATALDLQLGYQQMDNEGVPGSAIRPVRQEYDRRFDVLEQAIDALNDGAGEAGDDAS